MFTEDIIKRCQRLSLLDVKMMNIFINGLKKEIRNHVILNQPKSFAEADNLVRLRTAVLSTSVSENQNGENVFQQEQRIKELEGQVNLLLTFQKQQPKPAHALDSSFEANCPFQNGPNDYSNAFTNMSYGHNPFRTTKPDMIAAIDNRFQQPVPFSPQYAKRSFQNNARGHNLRTTDGQPICNFCQRVGHVSRYCRQRQSNQNQHQPKSWQRQSHFESDRFENPPQRFDQPCSQQVCYGAPHFQPSQSSFQQNVNGNGSSRPGN